METPEVFFYILKISLILGIFYGFYHFMLRGKNNHRWNRMYLLVTLILALAIPFIESPFAEYGEPLAVEKVSLQWIARPVLQTAPSMNSPLATDQAFPVWLLLKWIYIGLVGLYICRSIVHLVVLQKLKRQSLCIKKRWYNLYKTAHSRPFSFLSNVFIPEQVFGTKAFDQILAHECAHVRQLHSLDRLLVDFFVALFWFNPFIYLYRKALIEIHEYQADKAVLEDFHDPIGYQEILYNQLCAAQYSGLVSHFNFSTIKKRITMMNKLNSKRSGWYYFIAVPVTLVVVFAFSSKRTNDHLNLISNEICTLAESPKLIQHSWTDPMPSIFPVSYDKGNIRVSSGFGLTKDPVMKVERFHKGLDIVAPKGAAVIATAAGEVLEVAEKPDSYGKYIVVKHGTYTTSYNHLSGFAIKTGQRVKQGQVIGYVGNTGKSTGPHLHYEVLKDGENVDPKEYIKDYELELKDGC